MSNGDPASIPEDQRNGPIEVTFESRGRSRRRWSARFDLGDETENASAALEAAWDHNSAIVGVSP